MKTPNIPLTAVTLALALAGACPNAFAGPDTPAPDAPARTDNPYNQGTTADGKTIVAPGTYGPFQGPTCVAGSAGCSAAPADNVCTAAGDIGSLENINLALGMQQREDAARKAAIEANQKDEAERVKDGTFSSVVKDPSGKGDIITFPNGMVSFYDYAQNTDSMPKKPEDIVKDPNAPAWLKAAVQKTLDQKNPDKQQFAAANNAMFNGGAGGGKMGMFSVKSVPENPDAPAAGDQPSGDVPSGDGPTGNSDSNSNGPTDVGGMGGMIASANGTGGSGAMGGPAGSRADGGRAMEKLTDQAVDTAGDAQATAAGLTYTRLADFALHGQALEALRKTKVQASNGTGAGDDGVDGDKTSRGTSFFGR